MPIKSTTKQKELAYRLGIVISEFWCGACQFNLIGRPKFCPNCGKAVKWEADADGVKKMYTAHDVAELLAEVIGDDCACNVNGNDEWLSFHCDFRDTVCPDVCGVACWEQFLKHLDKKPKEADNE